MSIDRLTKGLLAAIAIALWINAVNPWIRPGLAQAGTDSILNSIRSSVGSIESTVSGISSGMCLNRKLC